MRKAKVTYNAPANDSQTVTMQGVTFRDGEATEINDRDHPHLFAKLPDHPLFDVEIGEEEDAPLKRNKGGRPSNAELAARAEAERDAAAKSEKPKDPTPVKGQGEPGVVGFTGTSPKPPETITNLEPVKE